MPRVARHELPWVIGKKPPQPQRGCDPCVPPAHLGSATTPLALWLLPNANPRSESARQPSPDRRNPLGLANENATDHPFHMPQSLSAVYIHLVFSTKDRRPLLRDKPTRDALHSYLGGVSKQLD